jgi:hypothetical protein
MFSGQYQQSLEVFNNFIASDCSAAAEWRLKSICLSSLIKKYNIKLQNRNVKAALVLSDVCYVKAENVESHLEKALQQDMLCGLAWFNLGDHRSGIGEIEGAAFCFTMCALVQRWDIEAWVNATACSFNNVVPLEIFLLLVRAAYFCNGDKYIESLYELFENQLGEEALSQVAQVIEQIISDERKAESTPVLRMLNKDDKFEDIISTKTA